MTTLQVLPLTTEVTNAGKPARSNLTTEVTYEISKDNVESAILNFLYQMNLVPKNLEVKSIKLDTRVRQGKMILLLNVEE